MASDLYRKCEACGGSRFLGEGKFTDPYSLCPSCKGEGYVSVAPAPMDTLRAVIDAFRLQVEEVEAWNAVREAESSGTDEEADSLADAANQVSISARKALDDWSVESVDALRAALRESGVIPAEGTVAIARTTLLEWREVTDRLPCNLSEQIDLELWINAPDEEIAITLTEEVTT